MRLVIDRTVRFFDGIAYFEGRRFEEAAACFALGGDAEDAIRALAAASGLAVDAFSEVVIRHDQRQPVTGGFFHLV